MGRCARLGLRQLKTRSSSGRRTLNCIYEQEFLGFSYGFRPGRSQHDALDALWVGISTPAVNWIVDADVRSFFATVNHDWLTRFVEHPIGDRRTTPDAQMAEGRCIGGHDVDDQRERDPARGRCLSAACQYLSQYCYDLWVQQWRQRNARGNMIVVRYADDLLAWFERESEARAFLDELRARFESFDLQVHPEKTRLLEFGRYAATRRKSCGLGKPETFTLGASSTSARNRATGAFCSCESLAEIKCVRSCKRSRRSCIVRGI